VICLNAPDFFLTKVSAQVEDESFEILAVVHNQLLAL
jgi:hypothetical protein